MIEKNRLVYLLYFRGIFIELLFQVRQVPFELFQFQLRTWWKDHRRVPVDLAGCHALFVGVAFVGLVLALDVGDSVVELVKLFVQIIQKAGRHKLPVGVVCQFFPEVFLHFSENHSHFYRDPLLDLLNFLDQLPRYFFSDRRILFALSYNLLPQLVHCLILLL